MENSSNTKILVVGDVMLDRYWWGTVNRISPEAPVPIVSLSTTSLVAGGAANVAANIAGLGATAYLVGITGDDEEARLFPDVIKTAGISYFKLFPIKDRKTTVKTRIVAHNQQIARLDQETTAELSSNDASAIVSEIRPLFDEIDIVVISDYAKGFLTPDVVQALISLAVENGKMILIDPKGKNYSKYAGATILTPNQHETADACGVEHDSPRLVEVASDWLLEKLSLRALLITRGEHGMSLLQKGKVTEHLESTARKVFDVTGAGDTAIATMAVALGSGMDFLDAARIANYAAGLVVEKVGTTPIAKSDLKTITLETLSRTQIENGPAT